MTTTTKKKPAAKPQKPWLQQAALTAPADIKIPKHQADTPRRLMTKAEVVAAARVSYVTIWSWMQAGTFPRSRILGGKSVWLASEVDEWLANLPVRRLKGDADATLS